MIGKTWHVFGKWATACRWCCLLLTVADVAEAAPAHAVVRPVHVVGGRSRAFRLSLSVPEAQAGVGSFQLSILGARIAQGPLEWTAGGDELQAKLSLPFPAVKRPAPFVFRLASGETTATASGWVFPAERETLLAACRSSLLTFLGAPQSLSEWVEAAPASCRFENGKAFPRDPSPIVVAETSSLAARTLTRALEFAAGGGCLVLLGPEVDEPVPAGRITSTQSAALGHPLLKEIHPDWLVSADGTRSASPFPDKGNLRVLVTADTAEGASGLLLSERPEGSGWMLRSAIPLLSELGAEPAAPALLTALLRYAGTLSGKRFPALRAAPCGDVRFLKRCQVLGIQEAQAASVLLIDADSADPNAVRRQLPQGGVAVLLGLRRPNATRWDTVLTRGLRSRTREAVSPTTPSPELWGLSGGLLEKLAPVDSWRFDLTDDQARWLATDAVATWTFAGAKIYAWQLPWADDEGALAFRQFLTNLGVSLERS